MALPSSDALADAVAAKVVSRLEGTIARLESRLDRMAEHFPQLSRDAGAGPSALGRDLSAAFLSPSVARTTSNAPSVALLKSCEEEAAAIDAESSFAAFEVNDDTELNADDSCDGWLRAKAKTVLESDIFQWYVVLVIVVTFIMVIIRVEIEAEKLRIPPIANGIHNVVNAVYIAEVLLRLYVYRIEFFTSSDYFYSCVDLLLTTAVVLQWLDLLKWQINVGLFRGVRIFRLIATMPIFKRIRFLRGMRSVLSSIGKSLSAFLWSSFALCFVIGFVGLLLVATTTEYRKTHDTMDKKMEAQLIENFGSLSSANYVLLKSITGGVDWGDVHAILPSDRPGWYIYFIFIIFSTVAMLNIITSLFVEEARKAGQDEEDSVLEKLREQEEERGVLTRVLTQFVDTDGSGIISFEELDQSLSKPSIREFFELQGLRIQDVGLFFKTVSTMSPVNGLQIDAFVDACMKVKGTASSLDVQALKLQVQGLKELLVQLATHLRMPEVGNMRSHRSGRQQSAAASILPSIF